ncbi:hypothetical protein [Stenotrophomonas sp.]|uniref:hypothetical protein n=1 Tax=Stenotrophomonas sp. TaxID=69392 RepID=UPI0028AFEB4F|nr:hypothetical protein [Stenotrophomonas sp.]
MLRKPYGQTLLAGALGVLVGAGLGYAKATAGYPVDWSSTGTMMQGWAALIAACAAAWGVNRWQQEIRFKRNAELAEKIMVSVEGLARALSDARSKPMELELDKRVPGGIVLTPISYELRSKFLNTAPHAAEIESLQNNVSAIFGKKHSSALTVLLAIHYTIRGSLMECVATTTGVKDGRLELEALELMLPVAESVVPVTRRGQALSDVINMRLNRVRDLFDGSI